MPNTLRLPNRGYMRRLDVEHILRRLYALQCVELIGMSNVGKSALLQLLADPDVWTQELGEAGREFFPVYVDCNRMLGLTEQGFCELVLRCLQESSAELAALPELRQLCSVSGEFDYLALLRAASTARLDALLDEIGAIEGVTKTTTAVVLARRIDRLA